MLEAAKPQKPWDSQAQAGEQAAERSAALDQPTSKLQMPKALSAQSRVSRTYDGRLKLQVPFVGWDYSPTPCHLQMQVCPSCPQLNKLGSMTTITMARLRAKAAKAKVWTTAAVDLNSKLH